MCSRRLHKSHLGDFVCVNCCDSALVPNESVSAASIIHRGSNLEGASLVSRNELKSLQIDLYTRRSRKKSDIVEHEQPSVMDLSNNIQVEIKPAKSRKLLVRADTETLADDTFTSQISGSRVKGTAKDDISIRTGNPSSGSGLGQKSGMDIDLYTKNEFEASSQITESLVGLTAPKSVKVRKLISTNELSSILENHVVTLKASNQSRNRNSGSTLDLSSKLAKSEQKVKNKETVPVKHRNLISNNELSSLLVSQHITSAKKNTRDITFNNTFIRSNSDADVFARFAFEEPPVSIAESVKLTSMLTSAETIRRSPGKSIGQSHLSHRLSKELEGSLSIGPLKPRTGGSSLLSRAVSRSTINPLRSLRPNQKPKKLNQRQSIAAFNRKLPTTPTVKLAASKRTQSLSNNFVHKFEPSLPLLPKVPKKSSPIILADPKNERYFGGQFSFDEANTIVCMPSIEDRKFFAESCQVIDVLTLRNR